MTDDQRSRKMVAVINCVLNHNARARGAARYPGMNRQVVDVLRKHEVGVIQMPCPEMVCLGLPRTREPEVSIRDILDTPEGRSCCQKLSVSVVDTIEEFRRNGYTVAEGIRRKAAPWRWQNPVYSSQYPIELCAEQWRETDRLVSEDQDRCERFLQVYYEDLTREPVDVLKQITDFLGLRSIPDKVLQQNWETHGVEAPIRNMNEKSLAQLSAADLEKIHQVAGETLARHGYEMPKMQ